MYLYLVIHVQWSLILFSGLVRRSSRIGALPSQQFTTPCKQGRPNAVSHASPLPCTPSRNLSDVLPVSTPQRSVDPQPQYPKARQTSPEHIQTIHVSPDINSCSNNQPQFDLSSKTCTSHIQTHIHSAPENSLADQSHDALSQSETELPVVSSEPCPEPAECVAESMVCSPSSQENAEENEKVDADPSAPSPTLMPSTPTKDLDVSMTLGDVIISACDG